MPHACCLLVRQFRLCGLLASALAGLLCQAGCQPPAAEQQGPSYADLVVTYNAELAALDRLEEKRRTLLEDFQRQQAGGTTEALKALGQALRGAAEGVPEDMDLTDLDQLADFAAQQAASAQDLTRQLGDTLAPEEVVPEETSAEEAASGEAGQAAAPEPPKTPEQLAFEAQLAQLDAEIAAQRERVERARQARDAAEK